MAASQLRQPIPKPYWGSQRAALEREVSRMWPMPTDEMAKALRQPECRVATALARIRDRKFMERTNG